MKQLLLLRHAKSSRDDPSLADFDRPLAPRGRKDAPRMGREIARRRWLPDLAIVSPAARTRETWKRVAAELGARPTVTFPEELYEATAMALLGEVRRAPARMGTVILVGHNPGMEELAVSLAGEGSVPDALKRRREKFPTAALARFEVDGEWASLDAGTARLTHFLKPADLE